MLFIACWKRLMSEARNILSGKPKEGGKGIAGKLFGQLSITERTIFIKQTCMESIMQQEKANDHSTTNWREAIFPLLWKWIP